MKTPIRNRFNPIKNLNLQNLGQLLDDFHAGYLHQTALVWEAIERRDDVLQGLVAKRKKSLARLDWEIVCLEDTPEAHEHKACLNTAYQNIHVGNAYEQNEQGGLRLMLHQMMDAVGKRYAVHNLVVEKTRVEATFVPLWFFENTHGRLRYAGDDPDNSSQALEPGHWIITTGEGLMESSSIAYLFKHLPLRDWLVYCERNGMPGVKGVTDFAPGSPQWEAAKQAVADFGAEFHALMSRGTDIEPIDLSSSAQLPYPALIDRMDRAMIALWRGSDLGTLSHKDATGASLQADETALIQETDAALISETLNRQLDPVILEKTFGPQIPKARFHLKPRDCRDRLADAQLYQALLNMGLNLSRSEILKRFSLTEAQAKDTLSAKKYEN